MSKLVAIEVSRKGQCFCVKVAVASSIASTHEGWIDYPSQKIETAGMEIIISAKRL